LKTIQLKKWSTLGFLGCFLLAMIAGLLWTASYWRGESWLGSSMRTTHGYFGSLGEVLGAQESLADRLKIALFIAAPLLCGLFALAALVLGFFTWRGRQTWPLVASVAVVCILGSWFGMSALRTLEDPIFFDSSPWVSRFKLNAYPMAILGAVYLASLLVTARKSRSAPKTPASAGLMGS
jgi:hypothetical protein